MSLKPEKKKLVARTLTPLKPIDVEIRKKLREVNVNDMQNLALIRPWLKLNEAGEIIGTSPANYKKVLQSTYNISYRDIKNLMKDLMKRNSEFKKLINGVRNALRDIDPKFRKWYIAKNDFIPPMLIPELSIPVPLTEKPFKEHQDRHVTMAERLGDIIRTNLQYFVYWDRYLKKKREVRILQMMSNGATKEEIKKRYNDLTDEEYKKLKKKFRELKRMKIDFDKLIPTLTEEEIEEARREAEEIYERLPAELKEIRLCPAYATNNKAERGIQRMIAYSEDGKESQFSRPALNIPFINYSPPKRIQIATHSIAKNRENIILVHGEEPIVKASETNKLGFDDLAGKGINLKFRFPRNASEFIRTYGGGVIISTAAAEKGRYIFRSPVKTAYAASKDGFVPEGTRVTRGDPVVTKRLPGLGMARGQYLSGYEGKVKWLTPPKPHKQGGKVLYWTRDYVIEREAPLRVGDKIMSRTGIKAVITDIIKDDEPIIIINPEDVWKEIPPELEEAYQRAKLKSPSERTLEDENIIKEYERAWNKQKGAFWKEIWNSGGWIFIFPEPQGFASDYEAHGLRLSWTFLAGALEREPFENIFRKYYDFGDVLRSLLKFLHLELKPTEDGKFEFVLSDEEPQPDPLGTVVKFKHRAAQGSPQEREYEYLYVPDILQKYYVDQEGYVRKLGLSDDMPENEKRRNYYAMRAHAMKLLSEFLFAPKFAFGVERKVVAADIPPDVVIVDKELADRLGLKEGMWVGLRKEPVTSANSILTLRVKIDNTGKYKYAFGINPFTGEQAVIDFDGDTAVLFYPPISNRFIPKLDPKYKDKLKSWRKKRWKLEPNPMDVEKLYLDDDALADAVREYNVNTRKQDNYAIKTLGVMRKKALILAPYILEEHGLSLEKINEVFNVERVMKAKKTEESEREQREMERIIRNLSRQGINTLMKLLVSKNLKSDKQLLGLRLDPEKFYVDRIIVWQMLPFVKITQIIDEKFKPSIRELEEKEREIKAELETLRKIRRQALSDFERISIDMRIKRLNKELKTIRKKLKNVKRMKTKVIHMR